MINNFRLHEEYYPVHIPFEVKHPVAKEDEFITNQSFTQQKLRSGIGIKALMVRSLNVLVKSRLSYVYHS